MATTRFDNHVRVLFKYYVVTVVEVEDRDGGEFGRRAARLGDNTRIHKMNQRLYNSVVCRIHMSAERERALAVAEKSRISLWGDDPVLPAKPLETDVQHSAAAAL